LKIVHPFEYKPDGSHLQNQIEVEVDGEVMNDKYHGFCRVIYKNPHPAGAPGAAKQPRVLFEGFAHFKNDEIHGGPAMFFEHRMIK
jgi:hypothetical protein